MTDADRDQLRSEIAHWRIATAALGDLDSVASPTAWAALESYLHQGLRDRLTGVTSSLQAEADALGRMWAAGADVDELRQSLLRLRARYLRAETLMDFYGDAVNSRTNGDLAELLQGYDSLASDSMDAVLAPLGVASPPALVYVDKGLGASILRAGIRLWDQSHPSPAAAIKLTRHNLTFPTALLHETGHQVLALSGYNDELRRRLHDALAPGSSRLAGLVSSWASELGADVHAVHHAGWAPVAALANVVDGPSRQVFRIRPGDPHPPGLVRTLFNVGLVQSWFGAGPWDDLAAAWRRRHPIEHAGPLAAVTREVLDVLDHVVEIASHTPMHAFHGASFGDVLDPRRASPAALTDLEHRAGGTLLVSPYLQRRESVRVMALLATRGLADPGRAHEHRRTLVDWVRRLGRASTATPQRSAA